MISRFSLLAVVLSVAAGIIFMACREGGGGGPKPADFGLDERPSNPTCLAPDRPSIGGSVELAPAFDALTFSRPVAMTQAPGDDSRWYLVEQAGLVRVFDATDGVSTTSTFVDVSGSVTYNGGNDESGLLGLAFHPDFASNGSVYLSYTAPGAGGTGCNGSASISRIARFVSSDGGQTAVADDIVLSQTQPYRNHNGGDISFGPDRFLYIGFGDGGSGGDPCENGQDVDSLLGKILRIDVDGAAPYVSPSTNPFSGGGGRPEIYAWGLRNPWRFSFDRGTGELWAGDVGQNEIEEIDRIELGGNYGWDDKEGTLCFEAASPCEGGGRIDPVVEYPHSDGVSVTGGFVYRGSAIPSLVGTYVFADFGFGTIWALTYDPTTGEAGKQVLVESGRNISSFAEGNDGELYVLYWDTGKIQKLVPSGAPVPDEFPGLLSETGCFEPGDTTVPLPGLIPYDVNAPLWSDGAQKRRWMALPDGTRIAVEPDGNWVFPVGTVLAKEFRIGNQRLETRLFVRHDDGGWAGYTYEWNEAQTDAELLPAGKTRDVGGQLWTFPSRSQCLQCHSDAAGRTLGPETAQMDRTFDYPSTNRRANQVATLQHIGMFDGQPGNHVPLPEPDGASPLPDRARAYLHANCSNCHRPGGPGQGEADMRYGTSLSQANLCDADPQEGDLGVSGAKLIVPGDPAMSLVSLRMHALDSNRMPDVGSAMVDPLGTSLVDGWIDSLTACP